MFKFVSKKEYWDVVDSGILNAINTEPDFSLKAIQDAMAFSYLNECSGKCIGEIGGGDSRLLTALAKMNSCFNVEEFKGAGGGPKKVIKFKKVNNILASIGDFSDLIEDEKFDVIFSVSVVEHVPTDKLSDFFKDCHRILKPSGLMVHLIDVYLEDASENNNETADRILSYGSFLDGKLFTQLEEPVILSEKDVTFSTSLATNPDSMMEQWNRSVPQLRSKRERAQSCTLHMAGRKVV